MMSFLFASSSIAVCSLYVKLDFWFFVDCFISELISFSTRSIYVLTVWCVSFGVNFSWILILKGTCSFGWFTVEIQVSSLKWPRSLISRKKFCKSEDSWFLLYLFEVGIKLRFLFRSLYVSKENECFDKFTTFPDGSDLYLSAFVIVRCSLKVCALFLAWNLVPLTDRCWFEYDLLRWRPPGCFFGLGCSSLFSVYVMYIMYIIYVMHINIQLYIKNICCFHHIWNKKIDASWCVNSRRHGRYGAPLILKQPVVFS